MTKCETCGQELPDKKEIKWLKIGGTEWSENLGSMNWEEAIIKCQELGGYLPSRLELVDLFDNHKKELKKLEKLDRISGYNFWSSTEDYSTTATAWYVSLPNGNTSTNTKTVSHYVRCARRVI